MENTTEIKDILNKVKKSLKESDTAFLKMGNKFFAVTPTHLTEEALVDTIHNYYSEQVSSLEEAYQDLIVASIQGDITAQEERIQTFINRNRGDLKLPNAMIGKLTIYDKGIKEFLEVRIVLYEPKIFVGVPANFLKYNADIFGTKVAKLRPSDIVTVTIKQYPSYIVTIGYSIKMGRLYGLGARTFHTHSDGRMCLGSHTASAFWKLQGNVFCNTVCQTNMDSLAQETVTDGFTSYRVGDLLRSSNIDSWTKEVTSWKV